MYLHVTRRSNMKKKPFILILILSLILTGCQTETDANTSTLKKIGAEMENPSPIIPTQAPSSDTEPNQKNIFSNTFEISASSIAQNIYGKNVESFSKDIAGYNVDIFPNEDYLLFCVSSKEDDFPMLIYAYDQAKGGTPESASDLIQPFINTLPSSFDVQCEAYNLSDSSRQIVYCAWIKNSNAQSFPLTIQIIPDTDYFLFTDIDEYKNACTEGRYNDIFSSVHSYIDSTNPPVYDNAYILQSILTPIYEDWKNIDVQYDSVEKNAFFYYSDVNTISDSIHFIPYAKTNEKEIHAIIGFYDSDWLFFDEIIISSDENLTVSVSKNKIEEVINGKTIYEAYDITLDNDTLEQLLQSPIHTLRFKGKNDSYKDYEMTDREYKALITIAKFQNVRNILSDLLFRFQQRQS